MLNTIGTHIFTWFYGKLVGKDIYHYKYYISKNKNHIRKWVLYFKNVDPSAIPTEWQSWLTNDKIEIPITTKKFKWEKERLNNKTGTKEAYFPSGSMDKHNKHEKVTKKSYVAWNPPN